MLEYATCAWSPHTKTYIPKVEQVQRSTARFVTGDFRRTSSATGMCANLVWDILHTRRYIRDATLFFFKIHHGIVRISLPTVIVTADARTGRHHEHKLRTLQASCIIYQHSFYISSIPMWISLNQETVTAPTAEAFQKDALNVNHRRRPF